MSETLLLLWGKTIPSALVVIGVSCVAVDVVFSCPAGQLKRWSFLNGIKPIIEMVASPIFAVKNIAAAPVLESVAKSLKEGAGETFE